MSGEQLSQERQLLELSIVGANQRLGLQSTPEAQKVEIRAQRNQMISRLREVNRAIDAEIGKAKP